MAVLDVAEGGVGKGRSCNWTMTSSFSIMLPRMSMQQSSFALAGVGRICLIRGGGDGVGAGAWLAQPGLCHQAQGVVCLGRPAEVRWIR